MQHQGVSCRALKHGHTCTPPAQHQLSSSLFRVQCSRTKAYDPPGADVVPMVSSRLRIYIYELPAQIAFDNQPYEGHMGHDAIYMSYQVFLTR